MRFAYTLLAVIMTMAANPEPLLSAVNPLKDEVITREERVLGLATVYTNIKQHFAYLDRFGEDKWDKAFMEYLPQVEKQQSLYEYYRVLQRLVALLEDGHTNVYFPPSIQQALDLLPIRLDIVEGKWVVVQRLPTDEVLKDDIPCGSVLESIEGRLPSDYFAERFYPHIAAGREQVKRIQLNSWAQYPKGAKVNVSLRYPDGSLHERALEASRNGIKWNDKLFAEYTSRARGGVGFWSSEPEPGILYLCFRRCDSESERQLCDLLESRKANWPKGVVLDLRDNPGGNTPTRCVSRFISKPAGWYYGASRWSISYYAAQTKGRKPEQIAQYLKERNMPDRFTPDWYLTGQSWTSVSPADIHYDGPLAILIGPVTGSAAEDLTVLLKQAGRATLIGDRTFGSTGQPLAYSLPGGGTARVCTMQTRYADGKEFINVGCEPDITVTPTIKGIIERRDEVLEAALKYLRSAQQ